MMRNQWSQVIGTNLDSVFSMTHLLIKDMCKRNFGRIIGISAINSQRGQISQVNYAAAKAEIVGFTKALALETVKEGPHRELRLPRLHRHRKARFHVAKDPRRHDRLNPRRSTG